MSTFYVDGLPSRGTPLLRGWDPYRNVCGYDRNHTEGGYMVGRQPKSPKARRWREIRRQLFGTVYRRDTAAELGIALRTVEKYETFDPPRHYRLALIGAAVVNGKRPSRRLIASVMGDGEQLTWDAR